MGHLTLIGGQLSWSDAGADLTESNDPGEFTNAVSWAKVRATLMEQRDERPEK